MVNMPFLGVVKVIYSLTSPFNNLVTCGPLKPASFIFNVFIKASAMHIFEAEHPLHNCREDKLPIMLPVFAYFPPQILVANFAYFSC